MVEEFWVWGGFGFEEGLQVLDNLLILLTF